MGDIWGISPEAALLGDGGALGGYLGRLSAGSTPPALLRWGAGRGLGVNPRQLTLDAPNILIFNEYLLLQNTFHTIFCTEAAP